MIRRPAPARRRARRGALLVGAAVLLAGCGGRTGPNVLLIVIDTARADRFTFNGYGRGTTPRLASLAREGAVYENAYSPSPWTLPAHASLFTGLFPSAHGADAGHLVLDDAHATMAEAFAAAGYDTVAYTASPWIGKSHGFHQGFDTYEEVWRVIGDTEGEDMGAGLIASRVARYLDWRDENPVAGGGPFFMFINLFEPHLPYNPPEPERSRSLAAPAGAAALDRLRRLKHPREMPYILGFERLDPEEVRILSGLYDGEIAYVDRRIGEIVEMFRRHGILDRTIVAITSDHGEMIGEHGLLDHKLQVYEPVLRIPLVLRHPPSVAPGQRIAEPVMLQDLHPTLLGLARVKVPERAGGVPAEAIVLPGVSGVKGSDRRQSAGAFMAEYARPIQFLEVIEQIYPETDVAAWDRTLVALRSGSEKLHWASDGRHALYDLAEDAAESRDLAADRPDRVRDLEAAVEAWLGRPGARPPIGRSAERPTTR